MITRLWFVCKNQLHQWCDGRKLKTAGIAILAIAVILAAAAGACEDSADLIIDNRTSVDLTIIHEALDKDGKLLHRVALGTVSAEQTAKMDQTITLRRDHIGWTVVLKAEDTSEQVVWQRTWSYEEFLDLEDVDWKITISP
ncbi:hypothetical protein ACFLTQ_01790 [Chloroflexota bacterium]